mgnify:CR=1 FL=1
MNDLRPQDKERLGSKEWRIEHFYKIKNKQKQLVVFKKNKAQRDFEKNRHSRNIILKSRQLGFTTLEAVDMLDDTLFQRNQDSLFIAQDLETAKDIFDNKIKLAWDNFALNNRYESDLNSARRLKVGFGDKTSSSIAVDNSGRAGTFHRLHITEFARLCKMFPDKAREVLEGSIPAVPTEGRVDIESTADGSDGLFYDLFWNAWDRGEPKHKTQFKSHFYNWRWDEEIETTEIIDVPAEFKEYQRKHNLTDKEISYYYLKFISLGETERNWKTMKKEYPTTPEEAFESSGNKLFDGEKLGLQISKQPIKEYNNFRIFEDYKLGHRYAMGCDVAEGIGKDSSTIALWDFTPAKPKIVAEYANNQVAPDMFAYEIKNLGDKYELPLVAVERNNHGHTTISKLKEIYPERHIYKDEKEKYGWQTNLVSKPKMLYELNTGINEELVELVSSRIISEVRRYDKDDLRILKGDEETKHYDLLIAAAIGFQMKNYAEIKEDYSVFIPE